MIVELSVENLAIIERCDLSLGPGFTVLTGETGAGKSLLVDALELAFGARAETGLVRSGAARALVSVTLDLSSRPDLAARCKEIGAEPEEGSLYLQREVFAEGRSQCRIGGRLAPVSTLREVGRLLVDLHGQHDHQSLLDPKSHLGFLDAWIGEPASGLLGDVAIKLQKWSVLDSRLRALQGSRRDREQRVDLLAFHVKEIEDAAPRVGELDELEARLARLQHAEQLAQVVGGLRQALVEGEPAGRDLVSGSVKALLDAERLDPSLARVRDPLEQAAILLDEALAELRAYEDSIESSPGLLEETAARIDLLRRLCRKYGDDEAAILEHLEKSRRELEMLTGDESDEESLAEAVKVAGKELLTACAQLSELRKSRAKEFSGIVQAQLQDLSMEKARFGVSFAAKEPDASGADEAEFVFSANPGEPLRPLSKIASGGEISRVMLAIKTALMGRAGVPTLIFDEVDVGLGGRAAAAVAKRLEELARHDQVIVITHLPQIAGRASAHFRVEKVESESRVTARAVPLGMLERVEELARMLSGEQVGDSALAHAKELLQR